MQRPLHLRYSEDNGPSSNKQPYIPTYGGNTNVPPASPSEPSQQSFPAGYQPVYFYPTGAPPSTSYDDPPVPPPLTHHSSSRHSRRTSQSNSKGLLSSRSYSISGATSDRAPLPAAGSRHSNKGVYEAPINYLPTTTQQPPSPDRERRRSSAGNIKHRRRNTDPEAAPTVGLPEPLDRKSTEKDRRRSKRESLLDFGAGHIFLSLSGTNAIKIKHAPPALPDKVLYDYIQARWSEGFESYRRQGVDWQIVLRGQPWTCKDPRLAFQARRVVTLLFKLLGNSGYSYVSAVSGSTSFSGSPTLIFASLSLPTPTVFYPSEYFCISFSPSQKDMQIIDAPNQVLQGISDVAPREFGKISEKGVWIDNGVYAITLSTDKIAIQDLPHRLSEVLGVIAHYGFKMEASVALGREGLFGMGGRKEIWIFRSTVPMPVSYS